MEPEQEFVEQVLVHQAMIHKICNAYGEQHDHDDLFQEIVMQLWKAYPKFDSSRSTKFTTWMYQIAFNTAATSFRRSKRRIVTVGDPGMAQSAAGGEDRKKNSHAIDQLYDAIRELNEIDRAITMMYLDELSYEEISRVVGMTESNVGVRMNRIKKRLRRRLDQNGATN